MLWQGRNQMIKKNLSNFLQNLFKKTTSAKESEDIQGKADNSNDLNKIEGNRHSKNQQTRRKIYILLFAISATLLLINLVSEKKNIVIKKDDIDPKVEVAAGGIKPDKMWMSHLEDKISQLELSFNDKLKAREEALLNLEKKREEELREENDKLKAQIAFAKAELQGASLELNRALNVQQEMNAKEPPLEISNTTSHFLGSDTEYDEPKNSRYYIPETTFITGYLIGGLAVSTAMSAPDSNTTPVVIKLRKLGNENLPDNFSVDISTCTILGSSYGDLSSERAIVRLEKMICTDPKTELVTTTSVAGTVYGDDGANGIKGTVISTGSKHIKAAMMGGIVSGLGQSAKGQEALTISPIGVASAGKQTMVDMLKKGAFAGAGNAAEKVADYYLKLAESVSPILSVPAGARVEVMFLKGFHIGELKTHAKIAKERNENKTQNNAVQNQNIDALQAQGNYTDE